MPAINDAGTTSIWYITGGVFHLATLWGPGYTKTKVDTLVQPFTDQLDVLSLPFTYASEQYSSFLEGFQSQATVEIGILNIGGRLIPRSLLNNDAEALTSAIRNISESGGIFSGVCFNVSQHATDVG